MLLLATAAIGGPLWAHIGSMLFVPGLTGGGGSLVVSSGGTADNKDNAFVVGKLRTTKFTLAMVAEWATIMGDWCLVMDPNWAPRDKDDYGGLVLGDGPKLGAEGQRRGGGCSVEL
jgi:hypothetical protein